MHCINCGRENSEGSTYCAQCGQTLVAETSSECPHCGHQNPKFAPRCGNCDRVLDGVGSNLGPSRGLPRFVTDLSTENLGA